MIAGGSKPYLHALKITDAAGTVLNASQDKFRQINKMVEIFAPLIQAIPGEKPPKIVDMGAGKGYLTFALYDYLANTANRRVEMVGIEFRPSWSSCATISPVTPVSTACVSSRAPFSICDTDGADADHRPACLRHGHRRRHL